MVHLDIRPANILLTSSAAVTRASEDSDSNSDNSGSYALLRQRAESLIASGQVELRLADFGHCRKLDETTAVTEGESRYCPRELIDGDSSSLILPAADIFSLGASILELRLGRPLGSSGEDGIAEWHGIRDGQLPEGWDEGCSREFSLLIVTMLSPDPIARPSAQEVLRRCQLYHHDSQPDGNCSCSEFKAC